VHSFFYGADTGLTNEYADIGRRFGPFDMVALEIGAYHPSWGDIHLGPDNALTAYGMLGSGALLPIHWGTFNLAVHPWDEPIETVLRRAPSLGIPLVTPKLGESIEPACVAAPDPWWRSVSTERVVESEKQSKDESALEWMPD
jgi:L-ascorbate metabolism protein UlaG (beta-lactamase superfamily)